MKKALISLLFGSFFLILFIYFDHLTFGNCTTVSSKASDNNKSITFRSICQIHSPISQTSRIALGVNGDLHSLKINGKKIEIEGVLKQYEKIFLREWQGGWERGHFFYVPVHAGDNTLEIIADNHHGKTGVTIGQSLSYTEYLLLFFLAIVPIIFGLYTLLFDAFIKGFRSLSASDTFWKKLPWMIIAAGILLRILFFVLVPQAMYQHDFNGHVEAIHYCAEHPLVIAQPDKGLEFPQQPLYYWLSAALYSGVSYLGLSDHYAIQVIKAMSVLFSVFWLILGLKLVRIYTRNQLLVNLFMLFLAFTPSFIFISNIVGNDSLNTLLGMLSLYAVSAFFASRGKRYFYLASAAILLAMFTKISSILYAVYFVIVLLVLFFQEESNQSSPQTVQLRQKSLQTKILQFGIAVLLIFGFSLLKSDLPTTGEFVFINSTLFPNQIIPALDVHYFFTFRLGDLITAAQSYVFGADAVRFSLPTYLYGTMFTGEFNCAKYYRPGTIFQLSAQIIYLTGVLYIAGLGAYLYFYKTLPALYKMLLVPVMINFLLIVKLLFDFWDVSNSDFRFFSPTFAAVGLIFVLGIGEILKRYPSLKRPIATLLGLLAVAEIYWSLALITATPSEVKQKILLYLFS